MTTNMAIIWMPLGLPLMTGSLFKPGWELRVYEQVWDDCLSADLPTAEDLRLQAGASKTSVLNSSPAPKGRRTLWLYHIFF